MLTLVHKCARCAGELEVSMPAVNSTSDMVVIVQACGSCEVSADAYEEVTRELQDLQKLYGELEAKQLYQTMVEDKIEGGVA